MSGEPGAAAPSSGNAGSVGETGTAVPGGNGLVIDGGIAPSLVVSGRVGEVGTADLGLSDEPGVPSPLWIPGSGIVNVPLGEGRPVKGDCAVETVARPSSRTALRLRGTTPKARFHRPWWIVAAWFH
jgi:hypothetical protein